MNVGGQVVATVELVNRAVGGMLGAAAGDAMGWPYEIYSHRVKAGNHKTSEELFVEWSRSVGGRFFRRLERVHKGEYSDDTQLLLCTGRSLLYKNWFEHFTQNELVCFAFYERGAGRGTKAATTAWQASTPPWLYSSNEFKASYYESGGNGVAMRILPHCLSPRESFDHVSKEVIENGVSTHGHPRALVSSLAYAYAVWYALKKTTTLKYGELINVLLQENAWREFPRSSALDAWQDEAQKFSNKPFINVWKDTVDEMLQLLSVCRQGLDAQALDFTPRVLKELGCLGKSGGAGTRTVAAALYFASRFAANPLAGLIEIAHTEDLDTDTIGSIAGGLLGVVHGTDFLAPLMYELQDAAYIRALSEKIVNRDNDSRVVPNSPRRHASPEKFKQQLLAAPTASWVKLLDTRNATVKDRQEAITGNNRVTTLTVEVEDGQTLFMPLITKVDSRDRATLAESTAEYEHRKDTQNAVHKKSQDKKTPEEPAISMSMVVKDVVRASHFYQALGLSPVKSTEHQVFFKQFSLCASEMLPSQWREHGEKNSSPSCVVYVSVSDVEKAFRDVRKLGAKVSASPPGERKYFFCLDFDEHLVKVSEAE